LSHEATSFGTCARSKLDEVVGASERFFVMLDEDEGVSKVAEMEEKIEESRVIGGVKTDAGFIEYVENPGQATADLSGEACTAGFPSRKSVHGTIEGEVSKTELLKKTETLEECFSKGFEGVEGGTGGRGKLGKPILGMGNRESTEGCDIVTLAWETAKGDGERPRGEAFSIAGSAKSRIEETAEAEACWFGFEAEKLALKLGNKAFEGFF